MRAYFPIDLLDTQCAPVRSKDGDAAIDIKAKQEFTLNPGETSDWIGFGFRIRSLPVGTCGIIIPRSGLGTRGLVLANGTGLIDPNYRGELKCRFIWDPSDDEEGPITITKGARCAQLIIMPYFAVDPIITDDTFEDENSDRGTGGFGSSGM